VKPFVTEELIFMTVAGSRMYGTNTPESDIDKRGVCVPPKNVVMGFARNFNQQEFEGEDTTVFSLQKFMKLAVDANPNIIELLFAPADCIETMHPTWERLLERRNEFLSAKAYHTFTGYAFSNLKRLRGHYEMLTNPPSCKPTREEFGLGKAGTGVREISKGVDVAAISPEVIREIERERKYKAALTRWNNYQTWVKRRNPVRAKLEARHGYDTKHAIHLVRLLRMGREILTRVAVVVRRPDAKELLAVRRGSMSYEELISYAEGEQESLRQIYESGTHVLPHSPNRTALSDFCVDLHELHWSLRA